VSECARGGLERAGGVALRADGEQSERDAGRRERAERLSGVRTVNGGTREGARTDGTERNGKGKTFVTASLVYRGQQNITGAE